MNRTETSFEEPLSEEQLREIYSHMNDGRNPDDYLDEMEYGGGGA